MREKILQVLVGTCHGRYFFARGKLSHICQIQFISDKMGYDVVLNKSWFTVGMKISIRLLLVKHFKSKY